VIAVVAPALVAALVLPWASVLAAAPVFVAGVVLALAPPHPRALARIGWMLVVASLATTALVVRA
jgi:hypothetical protein